MKIMKYGLWISLLAALAVIQPLRAQTTRTAEFKVYGQLLNPREYPDDARRHVKPPDWNLMGNQTHFTTLRQFRMVNEQLTGFSEDMERFTRTYDLGDFIWPNHTFLEAKNIPDLVDEIKRRNLFLYQIWGYVPGSGSGFWKQTGLPPETSALFETKLGDHWLGMDMGEQDGRYIIMFASQLYPSSADDRRQQYLNFHRYSEKITNECGNRMAALTASTYAHYYTKEGLYTFVGSEVAQEHPNAQVFYAFDRGAGKQDGVPWFGNASIYNRWGGKSYGGTRSRPTKGTSLSLLKRLLYSHILYNSMAVGFENAWFDGDSLSPIGHIQQSAQK